MSTSSAQKPEKAQGPEGAPAGRAGYVAEKLALLNEGQGRLVAAENSGAKVSGSRVSHYCGHTTVGNSSYRHAGELANPKNDAAEIAAALKGFG
jgi:hypothetical protein